MMKKNVDVKNVKTTVNQKKKKNCEIIRNTEIFFF